METITCTNSLLFKFYLEFDLFIIGYEETILIVADHGKKSSKTNMSRARKSRK
jgi:hypothetical protein